MLCLFFVRLEMTDRFAVKRIRLTKCQSKGKEPSHQTRACTNPVRVASVSIKKAQQNAVPFFVRLEGLEPPTPTLSR